MNLQLFCFTIISLEQPEQFILSHKSEQPTAGCIAIFRKYCCYIKLGVLLTVCCWYVKIPRCGCVECVLVYIAFYVKKIYMTFGRLFRSPTGSRRAARGACSWYTRLLRSVYKTIENECTQMSQMWNMGTLWFQTWFNAPCIYICIS